MGFTCITPVEVTPATSDAWTDVDVSASVPAGATGAIIHYNRGTGGTGEGIGLRKNGSTDNRTNVIWWAHGWAMVGLDANRVFEAYLGNATVEDLWLVGYVDSAATFSDNAVDKSLTGTGAWTDIDCSANAPGAIGLIFEVIGSGATHIFGIRPNGSTDNRQAQVSTHNWVIVGCDAGQIVEGIIDNLNLDFFLVGYITAGATFLTDGVAKSIGSTGAYVDVDCSASAPSATGLFFHVWSSAAGNRQYALRKNDSTEDIYTYDDKHRWAMVECDTGQIVEMKISNLEVDLFLIGYTTAAAGVTFVPRLMVV